MPKITAVAGPIVSLPNTSHRTPYMEKAVKAFNSNTNAPAPPQGQSHPVSNPTSIAPEEMSALGLQKLKDTKVEDETEVVDAPPSSGQPDSIEASKDPVETKVPETTEDPKVSERFAKLAQREKANRQRALALKSQEDALKAREEAFKRPADSQVETADAYKARLLKDPMKALTEAGLSYEQLTEQLLNPQGAQDFRLVTALEKAEARISELENKYQNQEKSQTEYQQAQYKQAVAQIRQDVTALVSKDPNYETIRETGASDDVVELIEATFKDEGRIMSLEDAAQAVEDYLVEEAYKLTKLKKIQQRLAPQPVPPKPAEQTKQQGMKTLTNAVSTSRKLNSRERAIAKFKGENI